MIGFSSLGRYGRLGNQLFQYAALRSVSLQKECEFALNLENAIHHGQSCMLKKYFNIPNHQIADSTKFKYRFTENDPQVFDPEVFNIPDKTDIMGFFQNTKYFEKYEKQIRQDLILSSDIRNSARQQIENIKVKSGKSRVISIHVRRGDVVEQTRHLNYFGRDGELTDDSIYGSYLKEALDYFKGMDAAYLVFTGGSRINAYNDDREWCKRNIKVDNVYFSNNADPIMDFACISRCSHNIMCHASTFGWWAAYLNKNPNKRVIAPKYYFIDRRDRFIDGFYPEEFILI